MDNYKPTASYNLIYVFAIHDERHKGILKIGKASLDSHSSWKQLPPNCEELNIAARKRIDQETKTALVEYELLHTELAIQRLVMSDGEVQTNSFIDKDVHKVLYNSHYRSVKFMESGLESEWFEVDLDIVKLAIEAVKEGKPLILPGIQMEPYNKKKTIELRKEQDENVKKTIKIFETYDEMLWNCKMRYGKTVTAYELIRRQNYQKVIVVTHRPAVEDGWDSDHDLIFDRNKHRFEIKKAGSTDIFNAAIDEENDRVLAELVNSGVPFTYFASMQDLRGSARVGGKFNKNNFIFDTKWDLVIIDEAHEGTQTELGDAVIANLRKDGTKLLLLSGTPYNIMEGFDDNIYSWTYVDEQNAKANWDKKHPNEKNPYAELPTMNILTFDLSENLSASYRYVTEDSAFNFREFFRVWTGDLEKDFRPISEGANIGDFVHERDVVSFLDLITKKSDETNYPFSTDNYRDMFRHTFWLVPGVKEAKALSVLLKKHDVFKNFYVANIAGDGDEEQQYDTALKLVKDNIKEHPYTITLSCGKLTTGVTVKEWTGIMMLSGSASTSASGYMQAIFRVQSPGCIDGKQKENCYVFDFAPDRALKVIANVHNLSVKGGGSDDTEKVKMGEFLNFCPIISVEGTVMRKYDVDEMMRQIKRISVEHAINSGFEDETIYKKDVGINMDENDAEIIRQLVNVVTPQKKGKKKNEVVVNQKGMTGEEYKKAERAKKKPKRERTQEEEELLKRMKELREQQKKITDLLRAVSIRLPLLFYGADADITETIHLKDFVKIVDDESWQEFMPKGLRKELFIQILKYYDEDVLVGAGLRIRKMAKAADEMLPTVRAKRIVEIIGKFKNPDKETVLTPWRVVNMHLGESLGGYNFFDDTYINEIEEPRLIEQGDITADILLNTEAKILEMNSKSGLYPLYMAYSLYMIKVSGKEKDLSFDEAQRLWFETLENNIFVLCKTKMARLITTRTLAGYSGKTVNAIYLTKLLERMQDKDRFTKKLTNPNTWNKGGDRMNFDAIVGNPPYQESAEGTVNDKPIYYHFMDAAFNISDKVSFITPARFLFNAGATPTSWNEKMLSDEHFKVIYYTSNSTDVFPNVDIKGGVAVTYRDAKTDFGKIGMYCPFPELNSVKVKVWKTCKESLSKIVLNRGQYRFSDKVYIEHPEEMKKTPDRRISTSAFERMPKLFTETKPNDGKEYIQMYGNYNNIRVYRWFRKDYLSPIENLYKYKVMFPKANGSGAIGEVLSTPLIGTPLIGTPLIGYTETYISVGATDSVKEAEAILKYVKSKFARALLGILKVTQDNTKKVWEFVPLQDFTDNSDIDWSKSIPDIDNQLYAKYDLSKEEIEFIETKVSPME
ncbi:DEAD/DEAH box helicase [Lachnospiraceae bacterium MD329]|nr:DEAD/DEAH box helicase [Lachnospiraceae bacterium MD329]